jgi:23S rRNA pseudouridine1911/1915/1917 synthase
VNPSLAILYEDDDCLAVSKRAGQFPLGTWAPPGETTLEQSVRLHLSPLAPDSSFVGIVHRIDRPTSGVLIWAKTPKAARRLSAQFQKRQVVKEYWAIVEDRHGTSGSHQVPEHTGAPAPAEDPEIWSDWLTRPGDTGIARVAPAGTPGARHAVTQVLRSAASTLPPGLAWLRMWPLTGRTHQLRAQTAARQMPILGDSAYGSVVPFDEPDAIALHARCLELRHPIRQTGMTLVAPAPPGWRAYGLG